MIKRGKNRVKKREYSRQKEADRGRERKRERERERERERGERERSVMLHFTNNTADLISQTK